MTSFFSMLKKTCITLTLITFASFISGGAFCSEPDQTERSLENGSRVMSPGWINIDKQRSKSLKEQRVKGKTSIEKQEEMIDDDLDTSLGERTTENVKADIKGRRGSGEEGEKAIEAQNILAGAQNITYNPEGTLLDEKTETEVINGKEKIVAEWYLHNGKETRYVYVSTDTSRYAINSITLGAGTARAGDVIFVRSGTYRSTSILGRRGHNNIAIIGENPYDTIIEGTVRIDNGATNITIKNFTIKGKVFDPRVDQIDRYDTNTTGIQSIGIEIGRAEGITIENNIIHNAQYGISLRQGASIVTILNNSISDSGAGIRSYGWNKNLSIKNNEITGSKFMNYLNDRGVNCFSSGAGIELGWWPGNAEITGNEIYGNEGVGVYKWYPEQDIGTYKDNYLYNNKNIEGFTDLNIGDRNFAHAPPYRTETLSSPTTAVENLLLKPTNKFYNSSLLYFSTDISASTVTISSDKEALGIKDLTSIFQGLLNAKDALLPNEGMQLDPATLAKLMQEALRESALGVPVGELTPQQMEIATMLASILNNPTDEQKVMIDAVTALLEEAQKLEEEAGSDPELKQASDDFTQMVATVLLAQALPDLLKEGDISNIKGIFGNLDKEKSHIFLEYQAQVDMYYTNMVKELAANITTLQIKDFLARNLTEKELEKLPTNRIDEIVRKIREAKDKTYTEERILKVEAKYREEYLIPAKRLLEENMKTLLQAFTQKLFGVLDGAGLVKEKVEQGKPAVNIDLSAR